MKLQKPPKGQCWVHIDHIDNEDGDIWAVQWFDAAGKHHYQTARGVVLQVPSFTNYFGPKAKQPRAVIVVPGGAGRLLGGVVYVTQG